MFFFCIGVVTGFILSYNEDAPSWTTIASTVVAGATIGYGLEVMPLMFECTYVDMLTPKRLITK